MKHLSSRRLWIYLGIGLVVLLAALIIANEKLNAWVDSGRLVKMVDRETSKGLKLDGHYSPIGRVGWLGARADSFTGTNGQKTIVAMDAHEISGWFNPWGMMFHRWQIDDIHIKWGTVTLQKTEATGEKAPGMPWWGLFWPYRVHLEDVKVDDASALWQLRGKESGIYHAFLEITPNGHDFEYDARGGELQTPFTPPLGLRHLHMLIRKPRLYCEELLLGDDPAHPEDQLRVHGDAGLQEDRSVKLTIDLTSMKVSPWLPAKWRDHISGQASGHLEYAGPGTGLETAEGHGHIGITNGVLHDFAPIRRYIAVTGSPDPGDLALKICETDLIWKEGALSAENLQVECDGVFRLEGTIQIARDGTLGGTLQLGLTDPYLKWLPNARTTIFTRNEGAYHFTTIQVSGTTKKPGQDLTARVMKQIEKSPRTELRLFFNQIGDWFSFD